MLRRRENVFVHIAAAAAAVGVFSTKLYGQRERERWGEIGKGETGGARASRPTAGGPPPHTLTQGESSFSFQIFFFPTCFFRLSLSSLYGLAQQHVMF